MNSEILNVLLRDRTTGKNILWANSEHGAQEIQAAQVDSIVPRHEKVRAHQKQRTRDRAEIFTPPDICKLQNEVIAPPTDERRWQDFVDAKFLEITCGEAPYLVSRYNAVTGDAIPLDKRIGLLDRKLRLVNAETKPLPDWTTWALRAVESVYGYEFQGDNLFLARRNVFDTVVEYFAEKFTCKPPENFWLTVATIISCNLWQMDGRTGAIPYANINRQSALPGFGESNEPQGEIFCKIIDWRTCAIVKFKDLTEGAK